MELKRIGLSRVRRLSALIRRRLPAWGLWGLSALRRLLGLALLDSLLDGLPQLLDAPRPKLNFDVLRPPSAWGLSLCLRRLALGGG